MAADLRVVFMADSIVAGVGDPEHLGWTGRLASRTHREGRTMTSCNLGVRRDTGADVANRWSAECDPRLPRGCDGRLVVSFGVNDTALELGQQRVETSRSVDHLQTVVAGGLSRGWSVLVVGPPPVADPAHSGRIEVLDATFREVCGQLAVPYASTLPALVADPAWMAEVTAGDGSHPGAEGYAALARVVWPVWQGWLTDRTSGTG